VISATRDRYLKVINTRIICETVILMGGGRAKKGDPIFTIYANLEGKLLEA
jgi:hypothetical protein